MDIKVNPKLNFIPVPGQSFSICIQYPHLIKKKNNKLARIEKRDKLLYYKNKNIIYYLCCALAGEILPSKGSCSINKDGYKYVTIENVSYYIKKFDKKIEFTIKKANRIISSHIFYN